MSALSDYIVQKNRWEALFGGKPIAVPRTKEECAKIVYMVEGELSPENLWCDGEASPAHVRRETKRLNAVMDELDMIILRQS